MVWTVPDVRKVGRTALFVAVVSLVVSLVIIWFDLGQSWQFSDVFARPQWTSMMAWMVWLYTAYFLSLLLVDLWVDMRCDLVAWAYRGGALAPLCRLLAFGRWPDDH